MRFIPTSDLCLFSYSYAARDLFRWAKQQGWKTILGQIDPGPAEDRLIQDLRHAHPEFHDTREAAPESYYQASREELELADVVIANSAWSAAKLRDEGVPAGRIEVVPIPYHSPSARALHPSPAAFSPRRPLRLLFLGQVNLRKGIAELLEAMTALDGLPVELHVVGPPQVTIPSRFRHLPSVIWHGPVPRQAIAPHLAQADLFVLPTHSDGFGLTQLEALGAGLPVLVSRNCAHLVDDGVTGRLLDEVSARAIVTVLAEILANPESIGQWSQACEIPERCRMESVAERLGRLVAGL